MEKADKPIHIKLLYFSLRLIPAFGISVLFFYLIASVFIAGHLKLFKNQMKLMHPEYEIISTDIVERNQLDYIEFYIRVNKHPTLPDASVHKGAILKIRGQASTLCIGPIIVFSLILAWPGATVRKRLKAILIAIPLMILLAAVDYPLVFISDIESAYSDAPVLNSIRSLWKHLMNNGGRQFFGVVIALVSIAMTQVNFQTRKINDLGKVGRNDPCPCGSDKKYKNCCLK